MLMGILNDNILKAIGPCPDAKQRIKDLYIVNTVAGWAKNQLKILADSCEGGVVPKWYLSEVERIQKGLETVAQREDSRKSNASFTENKPGDNCNPI